MSSSSTLTPLLTPAQLQSDLRLLSLQPDLLDPFLPTPTNSSTQTATPSSTPEPTRLPTTAFNSLDYARGFIQSTRKVVAIAEGENPSRGGGAGQARGGQAAGVIETMGERLEVIEQEVKGLGNGLEGI